MDAGAEVMPDIFHETRAIVLLDELETRTDEWRKHAGVHPAYIYEARESAKLGARVRSRKVG